MTRRRLARMGDVDAIDLVGAVTEQVDRRAPGLVRFLAALRWGGLRTIDPDRVTWGAEAAVAVGAGIGLREALRSASRGRLRLPVVPTVVATSVATHLALWRWDTTRWRQRRVALVVDLPVDDVIDLAASLEESGIQVERWERAARGTGRVHGLWCRSGDLRSVNGAIDAALSRR